MVSVVSSTIEFMVITNFDKAALTLFTSKVNKLINWDQDLAPLVSGQAYQDILCSSLMYCACVFN